AADRGTLHSPWVRASLAQCSTFRPTSASGAEERPATVSPTLWCPILCSEGEWRGKVAGHAVKDGEDSGRRRRLDVRAMARLILSSRPPSRPRARLRQSQADL